MKLSPECNITRASCIMALMHCTHRNAIHTYFCSCEVVYFLISLFCPKYQPNNIFFIFNFFYNSKIFCFACFKALFEEVSKGKRDLECKKVLDRNFLFVCAAVVTKMHFLNWSCQ